MSWLDFWYGIEAWPIAQEIGATWWFPLLESIHVLAAVLLVGSILMVDLRIAGLAARRYALTTMTRELVPWSWVAFAVAALTGAGLFVVQASNYVYNQAFLAKLVLLVCAGLNMLLFHFVALRDVQQWDADTPPAAAKVSGMVSLGLWCAVMLAGRWTGHIV